MQMPTRVGSSDIHTIIKSGCYVVMYAGTIQRVTERLHMLTDTNALVKPETLQKLLFRTGSQPSSKQLAKWYLLTANKILLQPSKFRNNSAILLSFASSFQTPRLDPPLRSNPLFCNVFNTKSCTLIRSSKLSVGFGLSFFGSL